MYVYGWGFWQYIYIHADKAFGGFFREVSRHVAKGEKLRTTLNRTSWR